VHTKLNNFILTGMLVDTVLKPTVGERVVLKIQIPGIDDVSNIPCIVRWHANGRGLGIQFEQLKAIETKAISRLILRLSENE